jgi:hypothetical protein
MSQNLMHADLRIADRVYRVLPGSDVQSTITRLTNDDPVDRQAMIEMLESLLAEVKRDGKQLNKGLITQ